MSIKDTARYLISRFLNSKISLEFKLNSSARSLLRYMADCMDMNFKTYKKLECHASREQLAIYSGNSVATVKRLITLFNKLKLIETQYQRGLESIHRLGNFLIIDISTRVTMTRPSGHLEPPPGHHDPTSNNRNNIINNYRSVCVVKEYKGLAKTSDKGSPLYEEMIAKSRKH